MIPCLTNYPQPLSSIKAFSLVELMAAVAFTLMLMAGVLGYYNAASQSYSSGVSGENLQGGANIVLSKIIQGEAESGVIYRLSTAVTYLIPDGTANALYSCGGAPQTSPCNNGNFFSEVYYCQDNPCGGAADASARWYYLNNAGNAVYYHHPAPGGGTVEEKIYSAPPGSTITLRFSPAAVNVPSNVLEIDVALTQNVPSNTTNKRINNSGAASTFVLLRNHS